MIIKLAFCAYCIGLGYVIGFICEGNRQEKRIKRYYTFNPRGRDLK